MRDFGVAHIFIFDSLKIVPKV